MILLLKSSKAHSQAPTKWQKQKTLLENKNKTKQKSKKKKICFWSWAEAGGAALPEAGLLSHQNNAKDAVKQELCTTIALREDILPAQEQKQQRVESMSATHKNWKGTTIREHIGMVFRVNQGNPIGMKLSITKIYLSVRSIRLGINCRKEIVKAYFLRLLKLNNSRPWKIHCR